MEIDWNLYCFHEWNIVLRKKTKYYAFCVIFFLELLIFTSYYYFDIDFYLSFAKLYSKVFITSFTSNKILLLGNRAKKQTSFQRKVFILKRYVGCVDMMTYITSMCKAYDV